MAEIPVQKKTGVVWWAWLLGLLLLASAGYLIYSLVDDDPKRDVDKVVAINQGDRTAAHVVIAEVAAPAGGNDAVAVVRDNEGDGDEDAGDAGSADGGSVVTYVIIATAEKENADPRQWVGERFTLGDLKVNRVTGDTTFWVTPQDSSREYLVVLDEVVTPDTKMEGRYKVIAGQVITVHGVVKALDEQAVRHWGLSAEQVAATGGDRAVYFHADSLDITERPQ